MRRLTKIRSGKLVMLMIVATIVLLHAVGMTVGPLVLVAWIGGVLMDTLSSAGNEMLPAGGLFHTNKTKHL